MSELLKSLKAEWDLAQGGALARVPLPLVDEIPDEDEMAARLDAGKAAFLPGPRLPGRGQANGLRRVRGPLPVLVGNRRRGQELVLGDEGIRLR